MLAKMRPTSPARDHSDSNRKPIQTFLNNGEGTRLLPQDGDGSENQSKAQRCSNRRRFSGLPSRP